MQIILEYDDFHPNPEVDCLQTVKELVNEFPNILINLFTIPCYKGTPLYESKDWCRDVRTLIESNSIRLAIHGTYHTQEEYKYYDYKTAVDKIKLSENIMSAAKLDFVKVFRGPHWGLCLESATALCDLGYTHIYSHNSYSALNDQIKDRVLVPIYNWNLAHEYPNFETPPSNKIIITHGHTHDVCGNGINESYGRLRTFLMENNNLQFLGVNEWIP
jgi:hypothetical protein